MGELVYWVCMLRDRAGAWQAKMQSESACIIVYPGRSGSLDGALELKRRETERHRAVSQAIVDDCNERLNALACLAADLREEAGDAPAPSDAERE